jgi:ATP-dependent helicase HrpA
MPEPIEEIPLSLSPRKIEAIHRSLLSGLLGNIATRSTEPGSSEYLAARGAKAAIFPGSALFKRRPAWIMSAELVETTRLYARTVAPIQPQWAERLAEHLVKRAYSEPHWQPQSSHVVAFERVTLYGLTLIARRSVHYGPIDPEVSRQLFIYHALVLGEYRTSAPFFAHNRKLIDDILALEAKLRRRDLLVEDQVIYEFFDRRIPQGIYNGPLFEKWRQHTERGRPTLLYLNRADLLRQPIDVNPLDYPNSIDVAGMMIPLSYIFDPSSDMDGVTTTIPLAALNQIPAGRFEWLVPGRLREKVIALMKTMPKPLRVKFVPVPEHADQVMKTLSFGQGSLHEALAMALGKIAGEVIDADAFSPRELPADLLMNFRIVDDAGEVVKIGRDLDALRRQLGIEARRTFQQQPPSEFHRDNITSWDFDRLPERIEIRRNAMTFQGYPALVDAGAERGVSLRVFDSEQAARVAMRAGVRRLLMLQLRKEVTHLSRNLPRIGRMCLNYTTAGNCEQLESDLVDAILDRALYHDGSVEPEIRTREQFLDRAQRGWRRMVPAANELGALLDQVLEKYQALHLELSSVAPPALVASYQDMRRHLAALIYPGFVRATSQEWLEHYPRYLGALEIRLRKLHSAGLNRDLAQMEEILPLVRAYQDRRGQQRRDGLTDMELERYRWMLEELRVSLFAQELKTAIPVSRKRLEAQWEKVKPAGSGQS